MSTERLVRRAIADHLGYDFDEVALDDDLGADLGADDLDLAEIAMALEDQLDIAGGIPDEEVDDWRTVREVVASVVELTSRVTCPHCGSLTSKAAAAAGGETDG